MKQKHTILAVSLIVLWSIACFLFFQLFYKYHLAHRLDLQLFLYTHDYLLSYFKHPAWLAALSGDFLTQFFYFEMAGPLVLTLSVVLLGALFYWSLGKAIAVFRKDGQGTKSSWFWVRVVLSLCWMSWEALRNCGIDYRLSSTMALIGALALFFAYWYTPARFRYLAGPLLLVLSYWLFGYGVWVLLLFILVCELGSRRYVLASVCLLVAIVVPFTCRQCYHLTVKQALRYPTDSFWDKPDFMIEKLLTLDVLSATGQWNKVALLTEKYDLKSGLGAYFFNLSHAKRGDLAFKLLEQLQPGPLALVFQLNPKISSLAIWSSNEAWFQLGDMTMAEHAALLGMIFSPDHRSVRSIKRLAEINMINGDTTATMKYLRMLQKTWLYKSWADDRLPGNESSAIQTWLQTKRTFLPRTDTLRDAVNPPVSLRVLLDSNKDNRLALDYLLCFDLLAKDIDAFMADYDTYKLPKHEVPEQLYAEGLLVGLMQRKASIEQTKSYLIPYQMFTDFANYTTLYEKGLFGRDYLKKQFGKTYWFYYHFATFK